MSFVRSRNNIVGSEIVLYSALSFLCNVVEKYLIHFNNKKFQILIINSLFKLS
jgi:hypothetical protein